MEWKNEVSPEQLLLPFEALLDAANRFCDQYAVGLCRSRVSALPDHYERAYTASLGNTGRRNCQTSRTPRPSELPLLTVLIVPDT